MNIDELAQQLQIIEAERQGVSDALEAINEARDRIRARLRELDERHNEVATQVAEIVRAHG